MWGKVTLLANRFLSLHLRSFPLSLQRICLRIVNETITKLDDRFVRFLSLAAICYPFSFHFHPLSWKYVPPGCAGDEILPRKSEKGFSKGNAKVPHANMYNTITINLSKVLHFSSPFPHFTSSQFIFFYKIIESFNFLHCLNN